MQIKNALTVGLVVTGLVTGAGFATAAPAEAAGKAVIRSIKILGYNALSNCQVGTNASQLTLTKQGKTVVSASCTQASNGTWTGVVRYRG